MRNWKCENALIMYTFTNWSLFAAFLLAWGKTVSSAIIVKPVDTEVRSGDSTYLNCSLSHANATVTWHLYPAGKATGTPRIIYDLGKIFKPFDTRFRIDDSSSRGAFNLIITKAESSDAGTYICQNGGGQASAELIVVESNPVLVTNILPSGFIGPNSCDLPQHTIQLSCSISYKGNDAPKLQLSSVKNGISFPIDESFLHCNKSDGHFICSYAIEADIALDGSYFACQCNRARNVLCNTKTEAVRIVYALGAEGFLKKTVGDEVTCSVKTNLRGCGYKWIWQDGFIKTTVSENKHLTIAEEGWLKCQFSCKVNNLFCNIDALSIKASSASVGEIPWNYIIYVILISCIIGSTVALIVTIIKKKKNSNDARKRRNEIMNKEDASSAEATSFLKKLTSKGKKSVSLVPGNKSGSLLEIEEKKITVVDPFMVSQLMSRWGVSEFTDTSTSNS